MNLENSSDFEGTKSHGGNSKSDGESLATTSAITSKDQQDAFKSVKNDGDNGPSVEFFDSKLQPAQSQEGDRYQHPFQDLVYRTEIDPVMENLGNIVYTYDGIAQKMSQILQDPEISKNGSISKAQFDELMKRPDFGSKFTKLELKTLELMSQYSESFFGSSGGLPFTRENLMRIAKQVGVLNEA